MNVAGYPGDKPMGTLWYNNRNVGSVNADKVFYAADTAGGQSARAFIFSMRHSVSELQFMPMAAIRRTRGRGSPHKASPIWKHGNERKCYGKRFSRSVSTAGVVGRAGTWCLKTI